MTAQLTDRLIWSPRSLGRSLISKRHMSAALEVTVLVGLSVGLLAGQSVGLLAGRSYWLLLGLRVGLLAGLGSGRSYWLLLGLFHGVSSETIEDQHRMVPNQGTRRSAFNGLVFGLISTIIVGLSVVLSGVLRDVLSDVLSSAYIWEGVNLGLHGMLISGLPGVLSVRLLAGLSDVLISGLSLGLLAGLFTGGLACLRHYVLRFLLWRVRSIPWNFPRFLDYAAEHILLRKVGGGYIFLHRLLLDYFAALEALPVSHEPTENREETVPPVEASLAPTGSTAPEVLPEAPRLLPCGHELRSSARFCSVCGAPVPPPSSK